MGLFDSTVFLNEGEQAEEYKARKAKEKEEAEKAKEERLNKRYAVSSIPGMTQSAGLNNVGSREGKQNPSSSDKNRLSDAISYYSDHTDKELNKVMATADKKLDDVESTKPKGVSKYIPGKMNKYIKKRE